MRALRPLPEIHVDVMMRTFLWCEQFHGQEKKLLQPTAKTAQPPKLALLWRDSFVNSTGNASSLIERVVEPINEEKTGGKLSFSIVFWCAIEHVERAGGGVREAERIKTATSVHSLYTAFDSFFSSWNVKPHAEVCAPSRRSPCGHCWVPHLYVVASAARRRLWACHSWSVHLLPERTIMWRHHRRHSSHCSNWREYFRDSFSTKFESFLRKFKSSHPK